MKLSMTDPNMSLLAKKVEMGPYGLRVIWLHGVKPLYPQEQEPLQPQHMATTNTWLSAM